MRDLARIDVPILVIQGDADRVLPFAKTGDRLRNEIKDARLVVIKDGLHAIPGTHADQINAFLRDLFLASDRLTYAGEDQSSSFAGA